MAQGKQKVELTKFLTSVESRSQVAMESSIIGQYISGVAALAVLPLGVQTNYIQVLNMAI